MLWLEDNKYKPKKYEENNKLILQELAQDCNRFFSEYEKEKKENMDEEAAYIFWRREIKGRLFGKLIELNWNVEGYQVLTILNFSDWNFIPEKKQLI